MVCRVGVTMVDMEMEIVRNYGFQVKGMLPYKGAYIINTDRGRMRLKKVPMSAGRIRFVHAAKEHLYNNGFGNLDRYCCTLDGEPYINIKGQNYAVSDFPEGEECCFDSTENIIKAARTLAHMHRASRGFKSPEGCLPRNDLGKLPFYFNKRMEDIKKMRKAAGKCRTKFDWMFIKHGDYFFHLAKKTVEQLKESRYPQLVDTCRKEGLFCHHDFTYHNIVIGSGGLILINFENCCFELKIYDLANFIRRKMRRCNWKADQAKLIIEEYGSVEPLSHDELYVLKLMLQYPQKFWRVANMYYNSRRVWSERLFASRMDEVISEIEFHRKFLEEYDRLFGTG